jgi:urocanate hydratase
MDPKRQGTRIGVPAPRGGRLRCRGWEQEGILRCLLNTLDPAVAEDSSRLVVYGGRGRAARSWPDYDLLVRSLEELRSDETLIVQSGKAVAVLPTHPDAPRVLISTAMVVPAWSNDAEFRRLEDAGLTMYGQMTAAAWFYIGTQGILGFTHETFAAVARRHFGGTLAGRKVVTAGLGGMGGAQGLAIRNLGGRGLIVEVDPERARRRLEAGWVDRIAPSFESAVADLTAGDDPAAIALIGNIAEVLPQLVAAQVRIDVATDQTAAHDLDRGYVPLGYSASEARALDPSRPDYRRAIQNSLFAHGGALVTLRDRGTIVFEYGNNLRAQLVEAGIARAAEIPGFVVEYVRPILAAGIGPYRWICLSGEERDLRRSEDAVLEIVGTSSLEGWFALARAKVPLQGLPARVCWLGLGKRHEVGLRLNELVRRGEIGPLALGRDHMDPASVASPYRETEGMRDGSDAIADWPILAALLNASQGASMVSVGNGGGVGIGRSIHSGLTVIADGSELAARKIARAFWTDPALGVARYADAGYESALATAREHRVIIPALDPPAAKGDSPNGSPPCG